MTIDETTIKFLNMKIERMHKEIEYHMDEENRYKKMVKDANKILDEKCDKSLHCPWTCKTELHDVLNCEPRISGQSVFKVPKRGIKNETKT